jgi:hypothetical protein
MDEEPLKTDGIHISFSIPVIIHLMNQLLPCPNANHGLGPWADLPVSPVECVPLAGTSCQHLFITVDQKLMLLIGSLEVMMGLLHLPYVRTMPEKPYPPGPGAVAARELPFIIYINSCIVSESLIKTRLYF